MRSSPEQGLPLVTCAYDWHRISCCKTCQMFIYFASQLLLLHSVRRDSCIFCLSAAGAGSAADDSRRADDSGPRAASGGVLCSPVDGPWHPAGGAAGAGQPRRKPLHCRGFQLAIHVRVVNNVICRKQSRSAINPCAIPNPTQLGFTAGKLDAARQYHYVSRPCNKRCSASSASCARKYARLWTGSLARC